MHISVDDLRRQGFDPKSPDIIKYLAICYLASLAYEDNHGGWADVKKKVLKLGFQRFEFIDKEISIRDDGRRETITPSGFFAETEDLAVYVFTGTEIDKKKKSFLGIRYNGLDLGDWFDTNLDDGRTPTLWGGNWQDGFDDMSRAVMVGLPVPSGSKKTIFAGHSQGAATSGNAYQRHLAAQAGAVAEWWGFGCPGYQDGLSVAWWRHRRPSGEPMAYSFRFSRDPVNRLIGLPYAEHGPAETPLPHLLRHLVPDIVIAPTGEINRPLTKGETCKQFFHSPTGIKNHYIDENYLGKVAEFYGLK